MRILAWLTQRRDRRGPWLYGTCLVVYLIYAAMYSGEQSFHAGATPGQLWFLVLPAMVIVAQLIFPTVLGWAAVLAGFAFYSILGIYFLVRNASWQPRADTEGFVLGGVLVVCLIAICFGLIRKRPFGVAPAASHGRA